MFNLMIQQCEQNYADKLMEELSMLIQKPAAINQRYELRISDSSWKIIDAKAQA
jgi:flagellar assembly factor FliW